MVLVDLIGFGIVLPLLPFYASEFSATPTEIGLIFSIYSFAQLFFSPVWGSLSDRIGRRPIMLMSTFGAAIAYVIFGLAGSLWVLFASRLIAGIMGGNISTAMAYITDVTSKEDRAKGMGLIGAAFGIGFMIGPVITAGLIHPVFPGILENAGLTGIAELVKTNRFEIPGFFAALLSLCSFFLVIFKLPETVDTKQASVTPSESEGKRASVFSPRFWKNLSAQSKVGGSGLLLAMMVAMFLQSFGQANLYSAFPLFCEAVLEMKPEEVSVQFFYVGLIAVFIQGYLIRVLTKKFKETSLFLVGSLFMTAGVALIGIADQVWMVTLFIGIMTIGNSLNMPTLTSLISQEAGEKNVGAVMGTSQGMAGLGRVIGPAWGGYLFSLSYGLPFFATGVAISGMIWIGWRMGRQTRTSP